MSEDKRSVAIVTVGADELAVLIESAVARAMNQPSAPRQRLWSVRDAAKALGISHPTLHRLIRKGLPTVKVLETTKVDIDEAIAWLKERTDGRR